MLEESVCNDCDKPVRLVQRPDTLEMMYAHKTFEDYADCVQTKSRGGIMISQTSPAASGDQVKLPWYKRLGRAIGTAFGEAKFGS